MKEIYKIASPLDLNDQSRTAMIFNLKSKRLFKDVSEWENFKAKATNLDHPWFVTEMEEDLANNLHFLGWRIESQDFNCKCGYCHDCWDRNLEVAKEKLSDQDKSVLEDIATLNKQIEGLVEKLSKEAKAYWSDKYIPRGPIA